MYSWRTGTSLLLREARLKLDKKGGTDTQITHSYRDGDYGEEEISVPMLEETEYPVEITHLRQVTNAPPTHPSPSTDTGPTNRYTVRPRLSEQLGTH